MRTIRHLNQSCVRAAIFRIELNILNAPIFNRNNRVTNPGVLFFNQVVENDIVVCSTEHHKRFLVASYTSDILLLINFVNQVCFMVINKEFFFERFSLNVEKVGQIWTSVENGDRAVKQNRFV